MMCRTPAGCFLEENLDQPATCREFRQAQSRRIGPEVGPEVMWISSVTLSDGKAQGERAQSRVRRSSSGLHDADLARYAARVRALASGNLVEWVHREPID
jgi:hypothetical protein